MLVGLVSGVGHADGYADDATLQCAPQTNQVLLRMGGIHNADPAIFDSLPDIFAQNWQEEADPNITECQLANGQHVEMKLGTGQGFPYGMGGGDPPSWISLWVDNRTVLSRYTVRSGYGDQSTREVSAILYEPGNLKICDRSNIYRKYQSSPEPEPDRDAEGCFDQPVNVSALPVDAVHESDAPDEVGTFTVAATYSRDFCSKFIFPLAKLKGRSHSEAIVISPREAVSYRLLTEEDLPINRISPFADHYIRTQNGDLKFHWDNFDFDNDGLVDTVIVGSNDTHYIDGDMIFVKQGEWPDAAKSLSEHDELEDQAVWARENGFLQITGLVTPYQTDRYTHFVPFRLNGTTFLFAYPTNRDERPTTILYRPEPKGRLDTVCMFQEVVENF